MTKEDKLFLQEAVISSKIFTLKLIQTTRKNFDLLFLFMFCIVVFVYLILYVETDITIHLKHIEDINANIKDYPANFAFYFIINALSGFSNNMIVMFLNSILILSIASVIKYAVSKQIITEFNDTIGKRYTANGVTLIALSLFFVFPIPDPFSIFVLEKFYLGRFAPIVWHNSTTILLFPFAILLFWKQLKVFNPSYKSSIREVLILNILVIANVIIKPSFIFVYLPVTFLFLLNKFRSFAGREFLLNLTPLFTGSLFIITQYFLIYEMELGSFQKEDSSISFGSPFKIHANWVPLWYIPISFLLSFALPIFTAIAYKEILKYPPFLYSLLLTAAGITLSAFIYETGPRMLHGNFTWQNIIGSYLLFLSTISFLTPRILDRSSWTRKDIIIMSLLVLHALSGILYLTKIGITQSFA